MQTSLIDKFKNTPQGRGADSILRACVHYGFCNATCPAYQLLGDELDGPRGRIYQIKQIPEGHAAGVKYARLAEIGKAVVVQQSPFGLGQKLLRLALRLALPYPRRARVLFALARLFRPLLPASLKAKIPLHQDKGTIPPNRHGRRVLLLTGCVQGVATPATDAAALRIFDRLGILCSATAPVAA